jgi:hypothetical protein
MVPFIQKTLHTVGANAAYLILVKHPPRSDRKLRGRSLAEGIALRPNT